MSHFQKLQSSLFVHGSDLGVRGEGARKQPTCSGQVRIITRGEGLWRTMGGGLLEVERLSIEKQKNKKQNKGLVGRFEPQIREQPSETSTSPTGAQLQVCWLHLKTIEKKNKNKI